MNNKESFEKELENNLEHYALKINPDYTYPDSKYKDFIYFSLRNLTLEKNNNLSFEEIFNLCNELKINIHRNPNDTTWSWFNKEFYLYDQQKRYLGYITGSNERSKYYRNKTKEKSGD